MGYVEELRALLGHRRLILCGSCVLVRDEAGRLLMQERIHPVGRWSFPGGLMELGESAEDTARRELYEETALRVDRLRLIGVYSGPNSLCRAANGDEYYVVTVAYAAESFTGTARVNDRESVSLAWFLPEDIPACMSQSHRKILADYLAQEAERRA